MINNVLVPLRSRLLREANSPQLAQRLETVLKEARRQAVEVVNVLQPESTENLLAINKLRTPGMNGVSRLPNDLFRDQGVLQEYGGGVRVYKGFVTAQEVV